MKGFGASGTIEQLYPHFGITAEAAAEAAEKRLHAK
jgi:transketolase